MKKILALWLPCIALVSCHRQTTDMRSDDSMVIDSMEIDFPDVDEELEYFSAASGYEPLTFDEPMPDTPFFRDAIDIYNSHMLGNNLFSIMEVYWRLDDKPSSEMIQSINRLKPSSISNEQVRKAADEMVSAFKSFVTDSTAYQSDDHAVMDALMQHYYNYDSIVSNRYNTFRYVEFTEDEYWTSINASRSLIPDYEELLHMDSGLATNNKLRALIAQEADFEKKCRYVEIFNRVNGIHGLDREILMDLFDRNIYSHQLFFFWRIWRCDLQPDNGLSSWSLINNELFNQRRRQIALTTLRHLVKHPNDIIAVNQFLMISAFANIRRFSSSKISNGLFEEEHNLRFAMTVDSDE